ncbi:MAG: hypothetical protein WED00_12990 [Aquisalimonadaceae bacterium]
MPETKDGHDRGNRLPLWLRGLLLVTGAALGTAAFLGLVTLLVGHPIQDAFASAHGFLLADNLEQASKTDLLDLQRLIANGFVLTPENVVSQMAVYYSGVIQTLVIIMTVLGVIAFTYVRTVSVDRAEDAAERATEKSVRRFFESQRFRDQAEDMTEAATEDERLLVRQYINDLDDRLRAWSQWTPEQLDELQERLLQLEGRVASQDEEEGQGADLQLRE